MKYSRVVVGSFALIVVAFALRVSSAAPIVWDTFDEPSTRLEYDASLGQNYRLSRQSRYFGPGQLRTIEMDNLDSGDGGGSFIEIANGSLTAYAPGGYGGILLRYGGLVKTDGSLENLNLDVSGDSTWEIDYTIEAAIDVDQIPIALRMGTREPTIGVPFSSLVVDAVPNSGPQTISFSVSEFTSPEGFSLDDVDIVDIETSSRYTGAPPFRLQIHEVRLVPEPSTSIANLFAAVAVALLLYRR